MPAVPGQRFGAPSLQSRRVIYPDVGLYHPTLPGGFSEDPTALPLGEGPRVGLLLMRSYLLAGNTAHYDGVIRARSPGPCPRAHLCQWPRCPAGD